MPTHPCRPIREMIADLQDSIRAHEALLDEAPKSMKPVILANIRKEKQHLAQLRVALRACETAHRA